MISGVDALLFKAGPAPMQLLQQAAFGACAVADAASMPKYARAVVVDLLEEAFTLISDEKSVQRYQLALKGWSMEGKRLQFCLMRLLCVLYTEVRVCHCLTLHIDDLYAASCGGCARSAPECASAAHIMLCSAHAMRAGLLWQLR